MLLTSSGLPTIKSYVSKTPDPAWPAPAPEKNNKSRTMQQQQQQQQVLIDEQHGKEKQHQSNPQQVQPARQGSRNVPKKKHKR
jgi:hypothetical protein